MRRAAGLGLLGAAALGLLASACSTTGANAAGGLPVRHLGPPVTYVAIGGSETVGNDAPDRDRQGFAALFDASLPPQTVYLNLANGGASVTDALTSQLPVAVAEHAKVATVWLGLGDLAHGVAPDAFGQMLGTLLGQLRQGGRSTVLVANLEPIELSSSYPAVYEQCLPDVQAQAQQAQQAQQGQANQQRFGGCHFGPQGLPAPTALTGLVDAYNEVIAAQAKATGSELVDIHAALTQAQAQGETAFSGDLDLTGTAHQVAFHTFQAALGAAGGLHLGR